MIVITGLGMISSVGLNMAQTCASVRAGISRFREDESYYCEPENPEAGEPQPLACAPVPVSSHGGERISGLVISVLKELIQDAGLSRTAMKETGLYLCLPPDERQGSNGLSQRILPEICTRTGIESFGSCRIISSGHSGGLLAADDAVGVLNRGERKFCIVVAADSYLNVETFQRMWRSGRLKSEKYRDAFVPGEGAAAFLLESESQAARRGAAVFAAVERVGIAREPNTIGSSIPATGEGLSEAVRAACGQDRETKRFDWVLCDLNGESFRAREWGYCRARLSRTFEDLNHIWHPADCIGDVGAASGAVLAALAARAFQRGYAPSQSALVWTSSDNGDRAAMILKTP